jgi:hypothetical protein
MALFVMGLSLSGSALLAQTAPVPAEPPLGRGHLWIEVGQMDLDDAADEAWGLNRESYLALEGYAGRDRGFYLGGEFSHSGTGGTTASDGDSIRDFDLWWLEMNGKQAFDLKHGLSVDAGLGWSLFYAEGREVSMLGGQQVTDPLADFGFGAQVFGDFNWGVRRFLIGFDVKYQWAFDFVNVNYSNLRTGAHVGFRF